jgi:hypothetical protein
MANDLPDQAELWDNVDPIGEGRGLDIDMRRKLMTKCAVLTCTNEADPRWFARDVNDRAVAICDGHEPMPRPDEVAVRPPDPSAHDLAARIVCNGYSPTAAEVERVAHALIVETTRVIVETARVKECEEELAELRDLADLVSDADISALPPELLAVRQRWIADRYAKEVAKVEAAIAEAWEPATRDGVQVVRCRRCRFEAFPFADATLEDHMKACSPGAR